MAPAATPDEESADWIEQRIQMLLEKEVERIDREARGRAARAARRGAGGDLRRPRSAAARPGPQEPGAQPGVLAQAPSAERTAALQSLFAEMERELADLEALHAKLSAEVDPRALSSEQRQELLSLQLEIETMRARQRALRNVAAQERQ